MAPTGLFSLVTVAKGVSGNPKGGNVAHLNRGPPGNQWAATHGARRETFSRHETDEISEIADLIREITPLASASLEVAIEGLAIKIWRRNRLTDDLMRYGVLRARGRSARHPAPGLEWLERVEAGIRNDLGLLGLSLPAAAKLGLQLKELAREREVDLEKLSNKQLTQLERLLDLAADEGDNGNGDAA
jgi:hypothetical protein